MIVLVFYITINFAGIGRKILVAWVRIEAGNPGSIFDSS